MVSAFLATGFLAVVPSTRVFANPTEEAVRYASKALYMELELNEVVEKQAKKMEKAYLPDYFIVYGPYIGVGARLIIQQRISYTWRF